jgi:translocation and assembly module TamA
LPLAGRWRAAVLAAALLGAVAPGPAAAFEIFGIRLFGGKPEAPPEGAVTYTVDVDAGGDRDLARRVRSASRLVEEAKEPSPGAAALLARARGDYQRILATLYAAGYYDDVISITVDGREAANLPIDTDLGDTAEVLITVAPGPPYRFGRLEIVNPPGPIENDRTLPKTPEELGLVPGAPAYSTAVVASEAALVGRWRERGHPKARIMEERAVAQQERDELDVYIAVDPGRPAVFGPTTVTGTRRMDPGFVAWYAGITPGEPFDPDTLERARDQLRRLGVFQASRVIEADRIGDDGTLPIELAVAESKLRVLGVGAKYSTLDGAGVEGYWAHRNLFGRAEKLRLEASVGGIEATDPDEYNYSLSATFTKPGVFTPWTDFVATVYGAQDSPDAYRARTVGGRAGFNHRIPDRWTFGAFGQVEYSDIDQTDVGDGTFLMISLPLSAAYDGSNNFLDPTRGFRIGAKAEPFYETHYANVGLISEIDGSVYFGLAGDRLVLAGRAAVGSIVGAPRDEIPANRLFFAGGGGSIRGYPYRGVGPLDANGDVTGGRSYFVGSAEARIGVTRTIGVVPFFDFGNAFESELPDFSEPLRTSVGLGLRYKTGLGPIRFDVAFPLDPYEGDPNVAFYVGLGQAF